MTSNLQVKKLRFINADLLKLLAAALMLVDHIGMIFFDSISYETYWVLRKIGRLSMPLFAFAIAEGCRYTRNKPLHFAMLLGLGLICFFVYAIALDEIYYNILITFSFSIVCSYALQFMKISLCDKQSKLWQKICSPLLFIGAIALTYLFCYYNPVDYGFWGCMLPVFASLFDFHRVPAPTLLQKTDVLPLRVLSIAIGLIILVFNTAFPAKVSAWSLLTIPILLLYSGKKGTWKLKYFFYLFYPLHLVLLQGLAWIL